MSGIRAGVPIVGIGASAGGLEALRQTLSGADGPCNMAFVVVQHLDPNHESMMAQLIERYTTMPVRQIAGGESVEADNIYVIPPGHGLSIKDGVLELTQFSDPRGMRRPIDDFFESLALDRGLLAGCVILSGTGADGSRGLRAVKEHGGVCVAQEPDSARYDGMPLSAIGTDLVDFVAEPQDIVNCLATYFERRASGASHQDVEASGVADHVEELCRALRDTVGHDFSGYKRTTLIRRIERRMQVLGLDEGGAYLERVRTDADECAALFRDFLINVTRFFRDPEAFESLQALVIAPLIRASAPNQEIRVWVPGCSSGEEAYSLAMVFQDAMDREGRHPDVQIFATDIEEGMLRIARSGAYPVASLADIPEPLRARFTIGHGDSFSVTPAIRDMVRFSAHSLVKDPPFSKLDLISCRNLLIYFDDRVQQNVLPLFHYALRPEAFLFLGPSETIGRHEDLFATLDQRQRIFRRTSVRASYPLDFPTGRSSQRTRFNVRRRAEEKEPRWLEGEAVRKLTQTYGPASLLVDGEGAIIASWGPVGRYFDFPTEHHRRLSAPSLAKPGLREVLGGLIRQSAGAKRHIARSVKVTTDYGVQLADIICDPVRDGTLLLIVRDAAPFEPLGDADFVELNSPGDQMHLLEDELRDTRHRLRSTVEELETANEELKSSNEEMMSMNEELQSTNEELTTVNDELKSKVDQLTIANADLKNFFDSTQLAVVIVDRHLRVRSFTDAACALFPLQASDRGRSLADVATSLSDQLYIEQARAVATTGETFEGQARVANGDRVFALRIIPYRRLDGYVDGATLVYTDITEAQGLERALAAERERLELAVRVAAIGIWEYDPEEKRGVYAGERKVFGIEANANLDLSGLVGLVQADDRNAMEEALAVSLQRREPYDQTFCVAIDGGLAWVHGVGRWVEKDGRSKLLVVFYDVTAERELLETRELLLREMDHRVKNLFAMVGSMVAVTAREAVDVAAFADDLRGRLTAMANAHALTLHSGGGEPIELRDLLGTVLTPAARPHQIVLEGDRFAIPKAKLTPLALILHEWATNAVKYGALSNVEGRLSVSWRRDSAGFVIDWFEKGAAAPDPKPTPGFGTRLIDAAARQLGAVHSSGRKRGQYVRRLELRGLESA